MLQHLLEVPPRVTGMGYHFYRGAAEHGLTTLIATIVTQINDPIGRADQTYQPTPSDL